MSDTARAPARRILRVAIIGVAVQAAIFAASRAVARTFESGTADDDEIRRVAVMNGVNLESTAQSFRHARIDLGMGGVNLDLTRAELSPEGATIELYGAMGGLNLTIPAGWRVTTESDNSSNGVNIEDGLEDPEGPDAPHLHIALHGRASGVNIDTA